MSADFAPIDRYLSQFGIAQLPLLRVAYTANSSCHIQLAGASTIFVNNESPWLKQQPTVSWRARASTSSYATLAFIDLGPDMGGTTTSKKFFPFIHSLWTSCKPKQPEQQTVSIDDCTQVIKPYLAPGIETTYLNRYTWILFEHELAASPLIYRGEPASRLATQTPKPPARTFSVDFAAFLQENRGMRATQYTFSFVRGSKRHRGSKALPGARFECHS